MEEACIVKAAREDNYNFRPSISRSGDRAQSGRTTRTLPLRVFGEAFTWVAPLLPADPIVGDRLDRG